MMRRLAWLIVLAAAAPTLAGGASHWTHTSEAEFKKGKFHNVVATNLGDLKLSRATKTLLEHDARVSSVYALAEGADGTIYAATGPQGILLQLKGDKVSTFATLEDQNVFSLLIDHDGRLLVGTGGEQGRILSLDPAKPADKPLEIFKADKVQYIWKIAQTADGFLYVATGPEGQIFEIKPDRAASVVLDTKENNILSLISDGKDTLYAGTDPNGLVYRINRKTKEVFVLFDAPEAEISALVLDAKGNLYAGTGQAGDADEAGDAEAGESDESGRPQSADTVPLPSTRPAEPRPVPRPDPAEPDAIPRATPQLMVHGPQATDLPVDPPARTQVALQPAPIPPPSVRPSTDASMPPGARRMPPAMPPTPRSAEGNAIYKIEPNGFVTEIFRQQVLVLALIEKDGTLLAGTGSDGLVYQINPATEETVALAKADPKQVMSLLVAKDGRIVMGLANVGGIASMASGYAAEGTFTSPVLDATQVSRFGKIHLQGTLPAGSKLTIATRSGNVQEPSDTGWSKWSAEMPAAEYLQILSPAARFFQYRLAFASADGKVSAVVDQIDVAYQMPNLAPQVKTIRITAAPEAEGGRMPMQPNPAMMQPGAAKQPPRGRMRLVNWEATDPNNDVLEFSLYFRSGSRGPWVLLQDKLKEAQAIWDTRGVADGRYWVKVVASDVKANPRSQGLEAVRISDPIVVDNTAPVIGDLKVTRTGQTVKIQATVTDRTSAVAAVDYCIDSKDEWQALPASDNICDSPEEGVAVTIDSLAAGAHQITLRASDDHGNQAYEAVEVVIEAPSR